MDYIDLGLPSGTLWAAHNEEGYYTFDDAVEKYGDILPTREQLEELMNQCVWEWNCSGYNVTGSNGNSIILPIAEHHIIGKYWSSVPDDSDYAWNLELYPGGVNVQCHFRCCGGSVRLVKNKYNEIKTKIDMNQNLNLVEILKDCPKGTILYSPICGKVEFVRITGAVFPIEVNAIEGDDDTEEHEYGSYYTFLSDGRCADYPNGECLLFPSRDNRDWSTFVPPKKEYDIKPFDKVLVRDSVQDKWEVGFFSYYDPDESKLFHYRVSGQNWNYCIPYEGNEHLIGTSSNVDYE